MPINGILREEQFRLFRNLMCGPAFSTLRLWFAPQADELCIGTPRAQLVVLAKFSEGAEFVVRKTHICLVRLHCNGLESALLLKEERALILLTIVRGYGLEFGSGYGG